MITAAGDKTVEDALTAAKAVIGSMLLDEACVGPVLGKIDERCFLAESDRLIFRQIKALFRDGKPVDAITVAERCGLSGRDERQRLATILEMTPTAANCMEYADLLRESATLWAVREIGQKIAETRIMDDVKKLLADAQAMLVQRPGVRRMDCVEGMTRFLSRFEDDKAEFIPWAIPEMGIAASVEPGNVVIIGAYPGVGKTALALQQAAAMAAQYPTGYYVFEGTGDQLYTRRVAACTGVPAERITRKEMTEEDWEAVAPFATTESVHHLDLHLIDAAGMTAGDIVADAQAHHYRAIIVDYAQKVAGDAPPGKWQTEYQRVTDVSNRLQAFAVRTGTAVYLLSQLTRPAKVTHKYKSRDGIAQAVSLTPPPTLTSLRSSGQLEQDADIVILMWLSDDDDPKSDRIAQFAKNRHGEPGKKIRLAFDGAHQTFRRVETRYNPPPQGQKKGQVPADGQTVFWADGSGFEEIEDAGDLPF